MAKETIVVGAGPAGVLLSFLLARRNLTVTLLERQTDFAREFRGEVLMPSGLDALGQSGLGRRLEQIPNLPILNLEIYRETRHVISIPLTALALKPHIVPQAPMLEMIIGEASRFPGFTMVRGATVRDLIMENGRVVGVTADTPSGAREFRGDLVVAADGRTSVIRKRGDFQGNHLLQGFDVVWFQVPGNFLGHTMRFSIGNRHLFIMYPSPEGHLQFGWTIMKGAFADFRKLGVGGWYNAIAPVVPDDIRGFLAKNRDALAHPVLLDVVCDRLRKWTSPGLLLIGDASHPMSPVGGQGINLALRDAIAAANHLVPELERDGTSAQELDSVAYSIQQERIPEVAKIQEMQQLGPRILFSGSIISRIIMSAPFVAVAKRMPKRLFASRLDPFLYGTADMKLRA